VWSRGRDSGGPAACAVKSGFRVGTVEGRACCVRGEVGTRGRDSAACVVQVRSGVRGACVVRAAVWSDESGRAASLLLRGSTQ
jgi:hypothetical protein